MPHSGLLPLHPEQGAVAIWRADAREGHRGLSAELAAMWSDVRRNAQPRWLWHASEHHTGQGFA